MAWTYFIAPLEPGDELTAAMLAELYAALDERLKAVNPAWGVSTGANQTALVASRLISKRVVVTGTTLGYVESAVTFEQVLQALSVSYLRPKFVESGTGTEGLYSGPAVLGEALVDLGAASVIVGDWVGDLGSTTYWNMIRRSLQLLRWLVMDSEPGTNAYYRKLGSSGNAGAPGLSAAVGDYLASGEITFGSSSSAAVRLEAQRNIGPIDPAYYVWQSRWTTSAGVVVAASAPWASWTPAFRPDWGTNNSSDESIEVDAEVFIDGVAWGVPGGYGLAGWAVAGGLSTAAGSVSLGVQIADYSSGAGFAAIDAALAWRSAGYLSAEYKIGYIQLNSIDIAGRPTFTYV